MKERMKVFVSVKIKGMLKNKPFISWENYFALRIAQGATKREIVNEKFYFNLVSEQAHKEAKKEFKKETRWSFIKRQERASLINII